MSNRADIHYTAITCCDTIDGTTERPANSGILQQTYSVLVESFAVRRFPTFCMALVGGYTFLQWPLRLLFDYASIHSVGKRVPSGRWRNASHAASRFLAALISGFFSLEILNSAIGKVDRKDSEQAAQDHQQHITSGTDLTPGTKTARPLDSKDFRASPRVLAGKTVDLTLLAVTRALDSLVVDLYHRSYPSLASTIAASSVSTAIARYTDTFVFALSSGTVMVRVFGFLYLSFGPNLKS